jgi:hypothetical protein
MFPDLGRLEIRVLAESSAKPVPLRIYAFAVAIGMTGNDPGFLK